MLHSVSGDGGGCLPDRVSGPGPGRHFALAKRRTSGRGGAVQERGLRAVSMELELTTDIEEPTAPRDSELPSEVAAWFEAHYGEDRVRLVQYADLHGPGHFGDVWIIASDRALTSIRDDDGELRLSAAVPLAEVESLELRQFVGNGRLDALTGGSRHDPRALHAVPRARCGVTAPAPLLNSSPRRARSRASRRPNSPAMWASRPPPAAPSAAEWSGSRRRLRQVPQPEANRLADDGIRAAVPMAVHCRAGVGRAGDPRRAPAAFAHRQGYHRSGHHPSPDQPARGGHLLACRHLRGSLGCSPMLVPTCSPGWVSGW